MGSLTNSNIDILLEENSNLKELVKKHPLLILDNIPGRSFLPLFSNAHFDEKSKPLIIHHTWEMGGGGGDGPASFFTFFLDPKSNLYLPTMVISGLLGNLAYDLAKKVFALFKTKKPNKRQTIIHYSESEEVTYFEVPSEMSVREFNKAVDEIPLVSKDVKAHTHFIRSIKDKKWIVEDNR